MRKIGLFSQYNQMILSDVTVWHDFSVIAGNFERQTDRQTDNEILNSRSAFKKKKALDKPKKKNKPITVYTQQMGVFSSSRPIHLFILLLQWTRASGSINSNLTGARVKLELFQTEQDLPLAESRDVFTVHYVWVHIKHVTRCSLIASGEAVFVFFFPNRSLGTEGNIL